MLNIKVKYIVRNMKSNEKNNKFLNLEDFQSVVTSKQNFEELFIKFDISDGIEILVDAIKTNCNSLKNFSFYIMHETNPEDVITLLNALKICSLKKLKIEGLKCTDDVAKVLSEYIAQNKELTDLTLFWSSIDRESMLTILNEGVKCNKSLSILDISISRNNFNPEIDKSLIEILKHNYSLSFKSDNFKSNEITQLRTLHTDLLRDISEMSIALTNEPSDIRHQLSLIKKFQLFQKQNILSFLHSQDIYVHDDVLCKISSIKNGIDKNFFQITGVSKEIKPGVSPIDDNIPLTSLPKELWSHILSFLGRDSLFVVNYLKENETVVKQIGDLINTAFTDSQNNQEHICQLMGDSDSI